MITNSSNLLINDSIVRYKYTKNILAKLEPSIEPLEHKHVYTVSVLAGTELDFVVVYSSSLCGGSDELPR